MADQPQAAQTGARFLEALAHHQQGRLAPAMSLYLDVLRDDAQHFDSLHLLGVIAAQTRRFEDAVGLIGKALAVDPGHAFACYNRGVALGELGRWEEAVAHYDHAVAANPDYPDAFFTRGAALRQLRRVEEALGSYDRAIALKPDFAEAHFHRGVVLQQGRRAAAAVVAYDHALAAKPDHAEAHYNRGAALHELKRSDEALAGCKRAIALVPDFAEAHYNRGNALKDLKQTDAAVASYGRALALKPDYAVAHMNRGTALQDLGRIDEARGSYGRALALEPGFAEAHSNHGNALRELMRADAALASYDRAVAVRPGYADAHYNKGLALQDLKRVPEAVASFERVVVLVPDHADAHLNKSLALLMTGDFERGLPLYEWRWKREPLSGVRRDVPQPLWLGAEPLAGKTILLHGEQGLGDTIQFCRYARLVAALGARVIMEVPDALMSLLAGLEGVAAFVARGTPPPAFDCHCPLMSLPLAFKTRLDTIPGGAAYLRSDPARGTAWAARLGPKTGPRVGLAWSGSAVHQNNRNRSLDLASLLQRLPADGEYVSLQKDVPAADQAALRSHPSLRHFAADFADTAALSGLMDVVVSVDTSIAHLGGALGRPTWLLLSYAQDWRWFLDREDSPWYASLKIYRQGADRDWAPVLERVRVDLTELAG